MRALIDTNVVIDVIESRERFLADSYAVLRLIAEDKLTGFLPAGSVADVYCIIRKSGKEAGKARGAIVALLELVRLCDTTRGDVSTALSLGISDFEDAILAATAKREKVDFIITRNERDFTNSPVPALSPKDFLARIARKQRLPAD
jgi:predicted nucleic acid-binding protein